MKLKFTLILALAMAFTLGAWAQDSEETASTGMPSPKDFNRWSVGLNGGTTLYQGDLAPWGNGDGFEFNYVFGGNVSYRLSHSIALRGNVWLGELAGQNISKTSIPNTSDLILEDFTSSITQFNLNIVGTLGNVSHLQRNKKLHLEANGGIGYLMYDSETNYRPGTIMPDSSRTADSGSLIANAGLGLKYRLGSKANLGLYYDYNMTFDDDLDLYEAGTQNFDTYSFITLGVNYTLGKKDKNMEWVNPMEIVYNDMADMRGKMDMLSNDKDNDGVADIFDKDNSTPEGAKVYGDGSAVDSDGDGVADADDADPFTAKGVTVDANGVAVDSDGDGVPDGKDLEANTPSGTLVNFQGVTIPKFDPSMIPAAKGGDVALPSIYFTTNSSAVSSTYNKQLLTVARALQSNSGLTLLVSGNADKTGGEEYNQKLAQKRAENVIQKLVDLYGVDASRLSATSNGETSPMTEKVNSVNRRVDFIVQ
ncbi:MAG: OmpA family protein [Bacteroidia bacterium]|nr:OmpA family protein [Bacteroidia bacterium]NNC86363.1 OmpA family protein [Bacteroidia bacterium]NNM15603.1 OmpA family protein [Bacteroidia bacterium]